MNESLLLVLVLLLLVVSVAALAVGLLDHYFFNIEFSHMVALFWGCIGLALAIETIDDQRSNVQTFKRSNVRPLVIEEQE